jgi:hypothetical protein
MWGGRKIILSKVLLNKGRNTNIDNTYSTIKKSIKNYIMPAST